MTALASVHYLASTPTERHLLDEAGHTSDVNAVLEAARTLYVDEVELTLMQQLNVTRILGRDARTVLAEVGDALQQVTRFENEAADGGWDGDYDPDAEAAKWRTVAWATARAAVQG